MDTAFFCRNVSNIAELKRLTMEKKGMFCDYSIIGIVHLDEEQYSVFSSDFCKGYDFLTPYVYDSTVKHGIWHCIRVDSQVASSILVMTNGYLYPRFVALKNSIAGMV